eukprot:gene2375-18975_t
MVQGMQEEDAKGHPKMLAYLKHFTAYSTDGVMCSYNAENGKPSCANGWLLNDVMRGQWSKDAIATTDCGVVNNMKGAPMGTSIWTLTMRSAVKKGLTTELFRAGRYDPPASVGWSSIGPDAVNSTEHQGVQRDAALQSFVKGAKIAVLGPQGAVAAANAGGATTSAAGVDVDSDDTSGVAAALALARAADRAHK